MFGYKRIVIAGHERGLLFRERDFQMILEPGVYKFFDPLGRTALSRYDLAKPEFDHELIDFLLKQYGELCQRYFQIVQTGERQVGLVYKNGKLDCLLGPGTRQLYWKGLIEVEVKIVDITHDFRIPDEISVLLRSDGGRAQASFGAAVYHCELDKNELGLLLVNGEIEQILEPGHHAFWALQRNISVEVIDTRLQPLEVSGQEILTKDKVSLRLNLTATYRVVDAVKARTEVVRYKDYLYRELQFALRQAVGTRSLDELLTSKDQLDELVFGYVHDKVAEHGLDVAGVGIKDIILPGDMKAILNQVVEAEKVAQANVIKRREETAATRSLLNTAKLMDENPTLLRLKELETLEKVTAKIDKLTVFGGLEGLLSDVVTISPKQGS